MLIIDSKIVYFNQVFNVKWFWAGNAFLLVGGGPAVVNNMFFIILADVTSEEERCVAITPYYFVSFRPNVYSLESCL